MMKRTKSSFIATGIVLLTLIYQSALADFAWEKYYDIVNVTPPENVDPQIGGLAMNAKGELVVCFHRGEVGIYNEETKKWSIFATGLHEP